MVGQICFLYSGHQHRRIQEPPTFGGFEAHICILVEADVLAEPRVPADDTGEDRMRMAMKIL